MRAQALAGPGEYLALLKPRVMSLVVFTGLTGLVCADTPMNPVLAAIAVGCIAVGGGASGAFNMAYEADLDARMRRTRGRPTARGVIAPAEAATLGAVLAGAAVLVMALAVNLLSAGLLLFTIAFYAVVYTRWLKRSTPQNIVIGGAAGALPPVVGWAAASGHTPPNAWLLFALILLWTPTPLLGAVALYERGLRPRRRAHAARRQGRARHALADPGSTAWCWRRWACSPAFTGLGGPFYTAVSVLGGLSFVGLALRLYASTAGDAPGPGADGRDALKAGDKEARALFAFSILYLTALFAALLVEHALRAFGR